MDASYSRSHGIPFQLLFFFHLFVQETVIVIVKMKRNKNLLASSASSSVFCLVSTSVLMFKRSYATFLGRGEIQVNYFRENVS